MILLSGHDDTPGREKQVQGILLGHFGNPGSSRLRVPENDDAKLPGSSGGGRTTGEPTSSIDDAPVLGYSLGSGIPLGKEGLA